MLIKIYTHTILYPPRGILFWTPITHTGAHTHALYRGDE